MKIKLEITSQPLTTEQKEAIEEKLQEIGAIVKGKMPQQASERAGRVIAKSFRKLRDKKEKVCRDWVQKPFALARNKHQSIELEQGQISLLCKLLRNELDKCSNFRRQFHLSECLRRIEEQGSSKSQCENEKWIREPFPPHRPLQSQNETPSEVQVYNDEDMQRKGTLIKQEYPLRGSFLQIEKKTAKLNDSFHKIQEGCSALYSALGQEFRLVVDRSHGSEKILTQVPVEIVEQVCDFVRDTEAFLSLYQNARSIVF
nr:MAG TPA: hypothetical protein [Caudoviricetes sp.]